MAEILAYVNKDGLFHRLHPVTKILFVILMCILCILITNIAVLALLVLAMLILAAAGSLYTEVVRQSRLIVFMSGIFILITLLTVQAGDLIGYAVPAGVPVIGGSIPLTWGALAIGCILSLRFMILIYAFQLFLVSTRPRDIVHTMEKAKIPIDYVLMFVIALRFIPTLQIEGRRIHEAQLARGYNPGTGFLGKIRSVSPIVIPLVSNALARANILGLTIDIRGYRTGKRTPLRDFPFHRRDYLAFVILACACSGFVILALRNIL